MGSPLSLAWHVDFFVKNLYTYIAYITLFQFNDWVGWLCCVYRNASDAIHNHVAIKLLVSGILTLHYVSNICTPV